MKGKELRALITLAGRVDPSLQKAMLKASQESQKSAGKIKGHWAALGSRLKTGALGLVKGIGTTILAGTAAAVVAFGSMGAAGLAYASDLTEVQNVVDVTFAKNAAVIDTFAQRSLAAYGITTLEAKRYTSTLGAMLKSMGVLPEEMLIMSQNLAALAGDMASFHNLKADEAFDKLRSGITGETEPLKALGINMSVANMQAYALSQGITTAYSNMSQAEQALLRYNYLMEVTADMQGDAERTSGSFARQQQLLKGNLQQVSGEVMSNMMPALSECMVQLNGMLDSMDTEHVGVFVGELANMAVQFMPLVGQLLPVFGSLLMALMPPLLELGQMLIPVVASVVQALVQAFGPLMPVLLNLVQMLLPPFAALLRAVAPLVSTLANVLSLVLAPAFGVIASAITPLCDLIASFAGPISELAGKIAGIWSKIYADGTQQHIAYLREVNHLEAPEAMPAYANGGIATRPSIFGEVPGVPEMAIPLRRGNARSLALLKQAAHWLGVWQEHGMTEEAPVVHWQAAQQPQRVYPVTQTAKAAVHKDAPQESSDTPQTLLERAARLFRAENHYSETSQRQLVFTYAPVFQGDVPESVVEKVKQSAAQMRRMVEEVLADKGRLAWD